MFQGGAPDNLLWCHTGLSYLSARRVDKDVGSFQTIFIHEDDPRRENTMGELKKLATNGHRGHCRAKHECSIIDS